LTGTANTASAAGVADGAATGATFNNMQSITTDGTNLYVADANNNKIRQIVIATGVVSSLTGTANTAVPLGATDGPAASASFAGPYGITTDGTNLYVFDMLNNKVRKIVISSGVVSSLTGTANTVATFGATDGPAASASFNVPYGITSDGANLYLADTYNNKIRKIAIATGDVSSLTGAANTTGVAGANDGAGATAAFNLPSGITSDGVSLYVIDINNGTIRKIQ
jgi:sugar lactone lactonase YvrE